LENDTGWKNKIIADKGKGTLTISDNGIGMDHNEIIEALGTIARSGTKDFLPHFRAKRSGTTPNSSASSASVFILPLWSLTRLS
jgi:molecular chaperone HtpG